MFFGYLRAIFAVIAPPAEPSRHVPEDPMRAAYDSAVRDIGEREDPMGSNSGAYVEGLRSETRLTRLAGGEWCAVFCSAHMLRAGLSIKSRSARRLVQWLARGGRKVTYHDLRPGLCGASLHKRAGGWHVRLWKCESEDGVLVIDYVGGNEKHQVRSGRFDAKAYCAMAKMLATA